MQRNLYEGFEGWVEKWSVGHFIAGELGEVIPWVFDVGGDIGVDSDCRAAVAASVCSGYAMKGELPTMKRMDICNADEQK